MNAAWEWNDINEQKAKRRFGIKHYRAGQRKLIQAVLEGRNALGVLPTGGGKSLCYQLPALLRPGTALEAEAYRRGTSANAAASATASRSASSATHSSVT